jgi:hypothetical protein
MVDCLTSDKGWTLEYVLALTYRQFACLWERYIHRKEWDIDLAIKLNPFASTDGDDGSSASNKSHVDIDMTQDGAIDAGVTKGLFTIGQDYDWDDVPSGKV